MTTTCMPNTLIIDSRSFERFFFPLFKSNFQPRGWQTIVLEPTNALLLVDHSTLFECIAYFHARGEGLCNAMNGENQPLVTNEPIEFDK